MLISKYYRIEFVHPDIRAIDAIQDIREAAKSAGLNLYSRYKIQLQYPMVSPDEKVYVEVKIPEEKVKDFSVKQLRGIAVYLLGKKCHQRYQNYVVRNRLLTYDDKYNPSDAPATPARLLSMTDRLEAIVSFTQLMERNDEQARDQISRILDILKE